jgi:hypothetical protein
MPIQWQPARPLDLLTYELDFERLEKLAPLFLSIPYGNIIINGYYI